MTNQKFASGAFVFTRARGITPKTPEDIIPIASRHGIDASFIPAYAGDRAAVGRAIQHTSSRLCLEGFLLRPIRRTSKDVVYGIVREKKDEIVDKLDHDHEATVTWRAEPNPAIIEGDHVIAARVRASFTELRGKLVAEDWSATISKELENLGAVPFREDGRIYVVPPQSLDELRRLGAFLEEIGINMVLAEIESETTSVVKEVVHESIEDQLQKLQIEVENFDSKQKPSMFARRLEEYQKLRQRALLYQSALGIGAERTEQVLSELETKVSAMLDIRNGMTVHKDGTVSKKGTPKARVAKEKAKVAETPASSLTFAGATFIQADCYDAGEMLFTSSDEHAVSSVKALESMGLAGKWQKAGNVEVSIQNSGPAGAETSIRVRTGGVEIAAAAKALEGLGIGIVSPTRP